MDVNVQAFPETIGHVFALGLTYRTHIEEVDAQENEPMMFVKHCEHTVGNCHLTLPEEASLWQTLEEQNAGLAVRLRKMLKHMQLMLDYEVQLGVYLKEDVSASQLEDP